METYKLNEMSELAVEYLFEAAKINIDGKHTYQVLGDIEPDGKKFKHGGIRIKISDNNNTRDTSMTSSFPIDTSSDAPAIRIEDVVYGRSLKSTDKSRHLDAAKAVVAYAFNELEYLYKHPNDPKAPGNFKKKLDEFNDLDKATKKYYIAIGGIS